MQDNTLAKRDSLKSILVVVITVLVIGSGLFILGKQLEISFMRSVGHTIIISGGLWMICRGYVKLLWRRYPWEQFPVKHIILEVIGISALTLAFAYTLYTVELRLNLMSLPETLWPDR